MATVFIFHGAYGYPSKNWFPHIKKELTKEGHKVIVPKFPTPKNQTLENWLKVFSKYEKNMHEDSIFIGHSVGCGFLLNVLEQSSKKIKSAYCVAGFLGLLGLGQFDPLIKTFTQRRFNWKKIRGNCKKFTVLYSNNDPYIPIKKGKELAEKLKAKQICIKNAGHFNKAAGYIAFPFLLKCIKKDAAF